MRRISLPSPTPTQSDVVPTPDLWASRSSMLPSDDRSAPKKLGSLVLTRHLGESIMIGNDVEVEIVGLKSGSARLKITAPRSVAVHRREVYDQIRENPRPEALNRPEPASAPAEPGLERTGSRGGLVLSRNVLQSIMIGDEVELVVVESKLSTVKLKVLAPKTVPVHRREVFDAIRGHEA